MAKHISEDTDNTGPKDNRASSHRPRSTNQHVVCATSGHSRGKELPEPSGPRLHVEFDMKDQLVRQTIMSTQEDVTEIKQDIKRIEEKIDQLK